MGPSGKCTNNSYRLRIHLEIQDKKRKAILSTINSTILFNQQVTEIKRNIFRPQIPVLASNKINGLRIFLLIGYHLWYQFHVLCLFCSGSFALCYRLSRPHDLPRLARIFDDHLFGSVAAVAGDFIVSAARPRQLHHAAIPQGVLVMGHKVQPLTFTHHHASHRVMVHFGTVSACQDVARWMGRYA